MPQHQCKASRTCTHEAASTQKPERRFVFWYLNRSLSQPIVLHRMIGRLSSVHADGGAPTNVTTANAGPAEGVAAVAARGTGVGGVGARAERVCRCGGWHVNLCRRCWGESWIDQKGWEPSPDER